MSVSTHSFYVLALNQHSRARKVASSFWYSIHVRAEQHSLAGILQRSAHVLDQRHHVRGQHHSLAGILQISVHVLEDAHAKTTLICLASIAKPALDRAQCLDSIALARKQFSPLLHQSPLV